jgi:4-hydroxy-3-methylbut-2-en-1-yl diphosphate reductase
MQKIEASSVELPQHFGFCEGVEASHRALELVTNVAGSLGISQVYGYHDIVHNETVTAEHGSRGVVFVDSVGEIPDRSVVVMSAHGSSPIVPKEIVDRGGVYFDTACPLVLHTHHAVQQARRNGERAIYITGPKLDHDEVMGTLGHMRWVYDEDKHDLSEVPVDYNTIVLGDRSPDEIAREIKYPGAKYRFLAQTTLNDSETTEYIREVADALRVSQPSAKTERARQRDVCRAVRQRQEGVRIALGRKPTEAEIPEAVVVVTDPESKNGRSYAELASRLGSQLVIMVRNAGDLLTPENAENLTGRRVFVTASASTPDEDTRGVVESLGGDVGLVSEVRSAFNLKGTKEEQIRVRLEQWLESA